jgi:hypothetical protein
MKNFAFVLGILFFTHNSMAEKMLNGCVINEWNNTKGQPTYYQVVSQGRTVYWLKNAEHNGDAIYSNTGDVNTNGIITNSDAVKACTKKGLSLPTKEDFDALQRCFEAEKPDSRFLSDKGLSDLYSKFPDMAHRWFWSSSVDPDVHAGAFLFNGLVGHVDVDLRGYHYSVRCVGRR